MDSFDWTKRGEFIQDTFKSTQSANKLSFFLLEYFVHYQVKMLCLQGQRNLASKMVKELQAYFERSRHQINKGIDKLKKNK
jgi:hypothetical protein